MATKDSNKMVKPYKAGSAVKKKTMPMKPGMSTAKKTMAAKPSRNAPKRVGTMPKTAPKTEAAKQLGVLTQPMSARVAAEKKKAAAVSAGRKAAASVPTGRGASGAAAGKTTKGTVTRGKSNFVLEALRNAANSMTTNREKAINEKMWREGGNRPAPKRIAKSVKPKGK